MCVRHARYHGLCVHTLNEQLFREFNGNLLRVFLIFGNGRQAVVVVVGGGGGGLWQIARCWKQKRKTGGLDFLDTYVAVRH